MRVKATKKDYIKSIKYDLDLYAIGYNIETFRIKDYKKYGIDYYVSYYVVIKKNGNSSIKRYAGIKNARHTILIKRILKFFKYRHKFYLFLSIANGM